jgi:hypothetical protein
MSDAPRKSRRVQEKQEAKAVAAKASEPTLASVASAKKKRAQAPIKKIATTNKQSSNNAGHSRPTKRAKIDMDTADEDGSADSEQKPKPKPKPKFRGDRGKLSQLTEFPFDVLLEVRFPLYCPAADSDILILCAT